MKYLAQGNKQLLLPVFELTLRPAILQSRTWCANHRVTLTKDLTDKSLYIVPTISSNQFTMYKCVGLTKSLGESFAT